MATFKIKAGTTEPQTFQVEADGSNPDLSGQSIAVEVVDKFGQPVTLTGTVAFSDATTGKWTYTPDGQLTKHLSPYQVRAKITGSSVFYSPTGDQEPDKWLIVDP